ncbi:hypothetical protein [Massilia sp. CF038]|uniref:hypothetical protein n=1 Tax=Massilia sp. CF038 TaxID=1881045 RepID=UPI0009121E23|nr:hypothetical protein [Massilia sp. CF038]SHH22750.1 hypothetical protein SAMN05428948_3410 [Massilia sp. CF038]
MDIGEANRCRFQPGSGEGHYESYFLRANHPQRPLAFWIRYTFFSPKGRPLDAVGEVWAVVFDGEHERIVAKRDAFPLTACSIGSGSLSLVIGGSSLSGARLAGNAGPVTWLLNYDAPHPPLMLLPPALYSSALPRAKALVGGPAALFSGELRIDGATLDIRQWRGSQNHNWGSRHTDTYAWGQVAGFDGAPDVFLECTTARLKLGPVWSPPLTLVVLRIGATQYSLNGLVQAMRTRATLDFFRWEIDARSAEVTISIRMHAPSSAFAGLGYANPPGGIKTCLNSKLATCSVTVTRPRMAAVTYHTEHRAAFEILTDRTDHGIAVLA